MLQLFPLAHWIANNSNIIRVTLLSVLNALEPHGIENPTNTNLNHIMSMTSYCPQVWVKIGSQFFQYFFLLASTLKNVRTSNIISSSKSVLHQINGSTSIWDECYLKQQKLQPPILYLYIKKGKFFLLILLSFFSIFNLSVFLCLV